MSKITLIPLFSKNSLVHPRIFTDESVKAYRFIGSNRQNTDVSVNLPHYSNQHSNDVLFYSLNFINTALENRLKVCTNNMFALFNNFA